MTASITPVLHPTSSRSSPSRGSSVSAAARKSVVSQSMARCSSLARNRVNSDRGGRRPRPHGGASGRDRELVVPGPAALRPRVLDAVRALGVEVRGLTAEEGRLDVLYRELVAESEKSARGGEAPS